jgi:biotin operon repressor
MSVSKRSDLHEHLKRISQKRWINTERSLHPTQKAILELSQREDISGYTLDKIADKIGLSGKWRRDYVSKHRQRLRSAGLLPQSFHAVQRDLLELSKREDITLLTLDEIAEKIRFEHPWHRQIIGRHLQELRNAGHIPEG